MDRSATLEWGPYERLAVPCFDFFAELAASPEFATNVWAVKPQLWTDVAGLAESFTMADVDTAVDNDFLDAGRGVSGKKAGGGGWKMAPVSEPRGNSFQDAKMRSVDVHAALKQGTVVFNSAGASVAPLAAVCLAALEAFQLPNCLNLYLTARNQVTSAPPHTDKQDVFVLQTCGAKRWRVYAPPSPNARPKADPLARGKAEDNLSLNELGEPLIDTVLRPGQVLYMPAGFPHTTDTVNLGDMDGLEGAVHDTSVHMTVGVDTHVWGLNFLEARKGALKRAQEPDKLVATKLRDALHWQAMAVPGHLGFLRQHAAEGEPSGRVAEQLVATLKAVEPERWSAVDDAALAGLVQADEVVRQLGEHADAITEIQRAMYREAVLGTWTPPPGMPPVSMFRVKPHMERLDQAMEAHMQWFGFPPGTTIDTDFGALVDADADASANSGPTGGFSGGISGCGKAKSKKKKAAKKKK